MLYDCVRDVIDVAFSVCIVTYGAILWEGVYILVTGDSSTC